MPLDLFAIQAVKLNNVLLSGIQGHAADYGRTVRSRASDGIVQPTFRQITRLAPRAQFSTLSLKTFFDALNDSLDAPMKKLDATNGLQLVGARADASLPGYASGSVHEALTALRGVLYATGLTWGGPDDEAVLSLAAYFISSNGTVDALIPSQVALPTQPIPTERFDLTSLTIGGTAVDGVSGFALSIDPKPRFRHNQGKVYPEAVFCAGVNDPVDVSLRFQVADLALARTIGALATAAQVVAVFSNFNQNSATRGANTVTLTLNNCLVHHTDAASGNQGSEMGSTLECLPRRDGANRMLTVATA